jgi:XapX domain-containing protein
MIIEILKATGAGIACGAFFSVLNLPIPAPPVLAGVMGIFGVFLGYILINWIR